MNKMLSAIISSRIHISFLFYLILSRFIDEFSLTNNFLSISIVFWHFGLYLFDRVYDWKIDREYQPNEAIQTSFVSALHLAIFLIFCTSFILFWKSNYTVWYWVFLFPLAFLYTFPIFRKRIKQILFLKNLYSAVVVWCLPVFLVIYLQTGILLSNSKLAYELFMLFTSVLVIEAFWDIRDKEGDIKYDIQTIPNNFGVAYTKGYIFILLLSQMLINQKFSIFMIPVFVFILLINERSPKIYFHLPIFILILKGIL